MTASLGLPARPAALPAIPLHRRLYGFGSIYGKTIRDSRLAILVMAAVLGAIVLGGGGTMASTYGTPAARGELAMLSSTLPPVLRGIYGNPVNVDTLGGFITWHYGAYFALLVGLWSILALSSTLATEASRGSLEFVAATPRSRHWIAVEKLAGHVAAVVVAMALIGVLTWVTGVVFARLPGDEVAASAAVGFAVGLGVKGLLAGSVAFALAPFVGRAAGAGLAGAAMLAGYVLNSYRSVVAAFDGPANLTWFSWTANHLPLAGREDWPSILFAALVSLALLWTGIEGFARRDVGASSSVHPPGLPRALLGVRGPIDRSFGELLPSALAWGIGLGLYGFIMAVSSRSFTEELARAPDLAQAVRNMVPGVDMSTTAGFLQLAFIEIGLALAGLAAATFVAGRSSDEPAGRLEMLLATPLTRARWAIGSGIGVGLAVVLVTALLGVAIGAGVALSGSDPIQPAIGTFALALYAAAMAGIGIAVGGVSRSSFGAPAVVVVAIGTSLVDLLAPALGLPDWVHQLALSAHMGAPLVGTWDVPGAAVCVALAVGGTLLGAWGLRRRDVAA